jgi:phospholipid transport system transporter-binding protein
VTAAQLHKRAEGLWELSGDITLANVPALYQSGELLVQSAPEVTVDMAPVGRIDSSSIALMLSWRRAAQAAKRGLVFRNVPPQVLAVARLCGVLDQLPLANAPGR